MRVYPHAATVGCDLKQVSASLQTASFWEWTQEGEASGSGPCEHGQCVGL